ncbi:MAG TPA: STAS domain-containing protein, partial [Acidimicrobiales bacterium]|nr:STAS domain-containing protein [Acidimicrobiales bacterium]
LDALVEGGAGTVVVDLHDLRICTSHGFDLLDRVHARLASRGGSLLLIRARGAVARTLEIVRSANPPFLPPLV